MSADAYLVNPQLARRTMILRIWVACILTLLPLAAPTQEPARCIELGPAANADGQYIIPLLIDSMDDVIYILFNSEQIASVEARRTDLLAGFLFLANPVADTLKVAFAGIQATTGSGTFAEILVPDTGVKPEFVLFMISLNGDQIPVKFDGPTDVRQISGPQPTTLDLAPNFPNPFNAQTTIPYALSEPTRVKLEIFNASGQRVYTLVDAQQQPGSYLALWSGESDTNAELSSGVYFYRLRAGAFDRVRRMVLLK